MVQYAHGDERVEFLSQTRLEQVVERVQSTFLSHRRPRKNKYVSVDEQPRNQVLIWATCRTSSCSCCLFFWLCEERTNGRQIRRRAYIWQSFYCSNNRHRVRMHSCENIDRERTENADVGAYGKKACFRFSPCKKKKKTSLSPHTHKQKEELICSTTNVRSIIWRKGVENASGALVAVHTLKNDFWSIHDVSERLDGVPLWPSIRKTGSLVD